MLNQDIISMPDKWEYPWYAAWDLAFHALPLSIVLAIDTSLSTRKDLPLELASARRFAHAILRPVDALSLYQFSETVSEVTSFTADLRIIDRGIDRIRMGSATALL